MRKPIAILACGRIWYRKHFESSSVWRFVRGRRFDVSFRGRCFRWRSRGSSRETKRRQRQSTSTSGLLSHFISSNRRSTAACPFRTRSCSRCVISHRVRALSVPVDADEVCSCCRRLNKSLPSRSSSSELSSRKSHRRTGRAGCYNCRRWNWTHFQGRRPSTMELARCGTFVLPLPATSANYGYTLGLSSPRPQMSRHVRKRKLQT